MKIKKLRVDRIVMSSIILVLLITNIITLTMLPTPNNSSLNVSNSTNENIQSTITQSPNTSSGENLVVNAELVGVPVTEYEEGDVFQTTGLAIKLTYSDGTEDYVTDITIDKQGELTKDDKQVVVSYGEYSFPININVLAKPDVTLSYRDNYYDEVAAEDLDQSQWIMPSWQSSFTESFKLCDRSGVCVKGGALAKNSVISIVIKATKKSRLSIVGMMAYSEEIVNISDHCSIKLDDTILTTKDVRFDSDSSIVGGNYYNWRPVSIGERPLIDEGRHTLTLTVTKDIFGLNIESFRFYATDVDSESYDINLPSNGSYKLEAEHLNKASWYLHPYFVENGPVSFVGDQWGKTDSNGQHVVDKLQAGSSIFIDFNLAKRAKVKIGFAVSMYNGMGIQDGTSYGDVAFDSDEYQTIEIPYVTKEWVVVTYLEKTLEQGKHTFTYHINYNDVQSSPWIDYVQFDVSEME